MAIQDSDKRFGMYDSLVKKSDINVPNAELQKVECVERENVLERLSFEEQKETYEKALK